MPTTAFVASGSGVQAGTVLTSDFTICTNATGSFYAQMPFGATVGAAIGDSYIFVNHSGQTVQMSPATTAAKIANGSAGAAFAIATTKTAFFYYLGSDNWAASLSA
jgi:hypothetical protein